MILLSIRRAEQPAVGSVGDNDNYYDFLLIDFPFTNASFGRIMHSPDKYLYFV